MAIEHLEIRKKKYLATDEDINPKLNFVNNKVIKMIEENPSLAKYAETHKLSNWQNDREYVRVILDEIQKTEAYDQYLSKNEPSFKDDKEFFLHVFKDVLAPNEKLYDYYESLQLGWIDDLPYVNTTILKLVKSLKNEKSLDFPVMRINEEDQHFMLDLFRKTVLKHADYNDDIDSKTPNWDNERIAELDMILIKMAITEFLKFPSIPTKVSINEYLEIAKDYSTANSSFFINGVLDKILKDYQEQDKVKKIGRGLL